MKLLGTFLGLSAANKLRFGAQGCEDGPAFWCDGLSKATQCSATEYCTKNEVRIENNIKIEIHSFEN